MGEQGEQDEQAPDGDGARAAGGPTPATGAPDPSVPVDERRRGPSAAVRVRRAVGRILGLLAAAARLVGFALAAVLLVRVVLGLVPVNPDNVIVAWIVRLAGVVVWGFRDLFLPADPRIALVANNGLAAVVWMAAGLIVGGVLSALGVRVAGRA